MGRSTLVNLEKLIYKYMNFHNWKMWVGLIAMFAIGGIQALHGLTWANGLETLIPVLVGIEHAVNGNTSTPPAV